MKFAIENETYRLNLGITINKNVPSYTAILRPTFLGDIAEIWGEDERLAFFSWLAQNPLAGDVIRESGGCRKVRWAMPGAGKSGGVRVIYFTRFHDGELWLLVAYPKSVRATIPGPTLRKIREESERGDKRKSKSKP